MDPDATNDVTRLIVARPDGTVHVIANTGEFDFNYPVRIGTDNNAYGLLVLQRGTQFDGEITVWRLTSSGATELTTVDGVPATSGLGPLGQQLPAVSFGLDGKVLLTTVVFDDEANTTTTFVHLLSPPTVV